MGKVIRPQRKGKGSVFTSHTGKRIGEVKMHKLDYAERHGYVKGVVKALVHEPGRGAPIAKVQFKNAYTYPVLLPPLACLRPPISMTVQ